MPHGKIEYASCPKCGKTAWGEDEIEELFGYRYGGTKPQSWCRECRSLAQSKCGYTDCVWHDEYPSCKGTSKCPFDD